MSSLRWRAAAAFAALAALVATGMGFAVYQLSAGDRADRARAVQAQRARIAASLYASDERLVLGATLNDPAAPAALRGAVEHGRIATYLAGDAVWGGAPARGSTIVVRGSFAEDARALDSLRTALLWTGAGATLAGALVGLLFATRLSRRLRSAARTARRVAGGDLDARIGLHGRDEAGALAAAVDRMADSLRERIDRERRFTADVAHELRTPLTGLVSSAALLPRDEVGEMIRGRAERLRALVEELLEIARLEGGAEEADAQWVDLAALAREIAASTGAAVEVSSAGPAPEAWTDPRRLGRVLVNVLENAARHGAPPVTVQVAAARIAVSDHGPGFPAPLLDHATERFATARTARGGGVGLGLAIAAGQAELIGARLELSNAPGGGATVTISLPDRDRTVTGEA